jgi:hypothetical protein
MPITYSPSSVAFGSVTVGGTSAQTVTLSNAGATAIVVPGPTQAGFSMSPSSVTVPAASTATPPIPGTAAVTVTFSPPAVNASYSGSLGNSTVGTCALTGAGVQAPALGFVQSGVDFGSVAVGSPATQSVTIVNPAGTALTYNTAPPFTTSSPSPTSVTVTFTPTAKQSYAGSVTFSTGVATYTCTLWGSGIDPSDSTTPDKFESEFDAAENPGTPWVGKKYYEIVVPNFSAVSAPSGVPVPTNYVGSDGATVQGALPSLTSASSFLRLGSSPETSEWSSAIFQNSVNLARLVADPQAVARSEGMSLASTIVSGNVTSTMTGNVDSPSASTLVFQRPASATFYNEGQPTTTGTGALSTTFTDLFVDGTPPLEGTPWDGTAFGTAQDPNFLLGFADDTRWRGTPEDAGAIVSDTANNLGTNNNVLNPSTTLINNTAVPNVNANRQAETLNLLTKGGWWDHSDGNRVSTTLGDKVEVIQGNYKLVVLGRQPAPVAPPLSNTVDLQACLTACPALLDTLETWYNTQAGSAGTASLQPVQAILDAQYGAGVVSPTDVAAKFKYQVQVWLTTQNTFITDMSGGHFQEQYPSPTPCIKSVEYSLDNNNEWTLYQDNTQGNLITRLKGRTVDLFQGSSRETYVGSGNKNVLWVNGAPSATAGAAPDQTKPSTGSGTQTDLRLDPMIASYTWAQSVYSQTGSESKPVGPTGSSPAGTNTNPAATTGPQPSKVNGAIAVANGDVVSATWANRVASYTGSDTTPVPTVFAETHAGNVTSNTYASSDIVSLTKTSGGNVTSTNSALGGKVASTTTGGAVTNVVTAKGAAANVTVAGGMVVNFTSAPTVINATTGGVIVNANLGLANVTNVTMAVANIVNLNVGLTLSNIDLTPISVHCGVASAEFAAYRSIVAPVVLLGAAPPPVLGPAGLGAISGALTAVSVLVGAVGVGVAIGESARPT